VLLIIAAIVLPSAAGQTKTYHVGLAGAVPPGTTTALTAQADAADEEIDMTRYGTVAEGEQAVRDREVLILSYLAVLYAQENPDAPATVVLSYFPATAPMVMTYRLVLSAVPTWQIISSALLTVLVIWALVRIAGRVYSGALLRLGGRVPLRDVWRSTAT
jgi:hypothetical protein